jgi:UDP-N-acetylmuramyl pentapeptide synthase
MRIVKQVQILVGLALLGAASFALADVPKADSPASPATSETVVVVGATWNCSELSAERARSLADKASQDGAYQRAGECYLAAGDHALANQAFAKASAQTSGDTSRKLAANLSDLKAQARQMKQAFQRR